MLQNLLLNPGQNKLVCLYLTNFFLWVQCLLVREEPIQVESLIVPLSEGRLCALQISTFKKLANEKRSILFCRNHHKWRKKFYYFDTMGKCYKSLKGVTYS